MAPRRFLMPGLALALSLLALPAPALGQDPEQEVVAVVTRLFDAMRTKDTTALRNVFDPNARLVTLGRQAQGTIQVTTVDQFVRSIASFSGALDEKIFGPQVRIDGNLATVWAFYTLHRDGEFSHCGVDAFQLFRLPDGWKIVHLADTRRMQPCNPPGLGA